MAISSKNSFIADLSFSDGRVLQGQVYFEYDYPIGWIIQCSYFEFNISTDFNNVGLTKFWAKGESTSGPETFFYTAFDYENNPNNVRNQQIIPYIGGTFKVFGNRIFTFFQTLSDLESSKVVVVAYPQIAQNQGANLEVAKSVFVLQPSSNEPFPNFATEFCLSATANFAAYTITLQDKDRNTLATYTQANFAIGQYAPLPYNAVYIKNDGLADIYIAVKYYQ